MCCQTYCPLVFEVIFELLLRAILTQTFVPTKTREITVLQPNPGFNQSTVKINEIKTIGQ